MITHSFSSFNISVIALFFIIVNVFLAIPLGLITDQIIFEPIGFIGAASIIVFCLITYLSIQSDKLYFTLIVFIFIAFPSKVNNILPGIEYGIKGNTTIAFQLFTHIDIYLLIGIFKAVFYSNKLNIKNNSLYTFTITALLFSYFVNSITSSASTYEYLLLVTGFYQMRYLVLIYFLFCLYRPQDYKYQILNGVYISILFLLIESTINTFISGGNRLSSGTLNLNTLGNITAQIVLVLFIIGGKYKLLTLRYMFNSIVLIIALYISIATETRIALISIVLLGSYLFLRKWKMLKRFITILIVSVSILVLVSTLNWNTLVPDRYHLINLADKIEFDFSKNSLQEKIKIHWSPETSSIITRLDLYQTSLNMIVDNPITGIGANKWNFEKKHYGSSFDILINSHNGYLNVIAENGLPSIFLLVLIYFYPYYTAKKLSYSSLRDPILYFSLINLGIAICDLSNSTINKHSVFAFLAFNSIYLIFYNKEELFENSTRTSKSLSYVKSKS